MYRCKNDATVPSPQCEQEVLEAVLGRLVAFPSAMEQWRAAGEGFVHSYFPFAACIGWGSRYSGGNASVLQIDHPHLPPVLCRRHPASAGQQGKRETSPYASPRPFCGS
jgi:hypothetical protein